jgi:hypothetical protein
MKLFTKGTRGVSSQLVIGSGKAKTTLRCPLLPEQKTLFFLEFSFETVVLSKIEYHSVIHSQGCEAAWTFMIQEVLNGIKIIYWGRNTSLRFY